MAGNVRDFTLKHELFGRRIWCECKLFQEGIQIGIYGGDKPHIGAVSVADEDGKITTVQFDGHKDGVISAQWCKTFSESGFRPAAVTAGIHYDNLSRDGIENVLKLTDEMLGEALKAAAH